MTIKPTITFELNSDSKPSLQEVLLCGLRTLKKLPSNYIAEAHDTSFAFNQAPGKTAQLAPGWSVEIIVRLQEVEPRPYGGEKD